MAPPGAGPEFDRPILDSYWVIPGRLLAGEYPGARQEAPARERLRAFLTAGITCFIDLTAEDELEPYERLLAEEARWLGRPVEYHRLPIPDFGVPTPAGMRHILAFVDEALARDQAIYIHCWGGKGRTGTVVGCYLVEHGCTGPEALVKIRALRQVMPSEERTKTSPETEQQRRMVIEWHKGL